MLAIAVLAAQYAGTFDLSDTTSIIARTTEPALVIARGDRLKKVLIASDLTTAPVARVRLRERRWQSTLSYSPVLTGTDVELGFDPQLFHSGSASIDWRDRFVSVSMSEFASYGTTFVFQQLTAPTQAMLAPGGPTAPLTQMTAPMTMTTTQTPTLQSGLVQFGSSNTNGTVSVRTGKRTTIGLAAGYRVSGGINETAQALFPEQYGPSVGAYVDYTDSRRDSFNVSGTASEFVTSGSCLPPQTGHCREDVPLAILQGTLKHQVSPLLTLTAGAGGGLTEVSTATETMRLIAPVGSAVLSYRLPPHGTDQLDLSAALAPAIDMISGSASYRFRGAASLSHPLSRTITLSANAGAIKSVPFPILVSFSAQATGIPSDPYPFSAVDGGVDSKFRLSKKRFLTVGTHEFLQYQSIYGTLASTTTFARLTLTSEFEVGAGVQVFWPGASSYATLAGPVSTSSFVSLTGRVPTLPF